MGSENLSTLSKVVNIITGKLDSNQASENGKYPFFTCAPKPLAIDNFAFDSDAILLAGNNANGVFHLNRFNGKFNAYQRTYVITNKDESILSLDYLFYQLKTLTTLFGSFSQGTATKFLTMKLLSPLEIKLPPLPQQKAIAHILGSLDDKIELNHQMNETLEAMAQALFKSWFVDFDPVIDNAIAAGNPIPDEWLERAKQRQAMPSSDSNNQAIRALFPDAFEFTEEMGWIPSGWKVEHSGKLFDVRDGTHDSPKKAEEGKYLITSRHITSGVIDYSNAYLISQEDFDEVNRRSKVDSYDILLTMIGTVGVSLIVLQSDIDFAIKNVGLFKTGQDRKFSIFFYLYLNSTYMEQYLDSRLAGTTQKYLTLKVLRSLPVICSSEE